MARTPFASSINFFEAVIFPLGGLSFVNIYLDDLVSCRIVCGSSDPCLNTADISSNGVCRDADDRLKDAFLIRLLTSVGCVDQVLVVDQAILVKTIMIVSLSAVMMIFFF